MAKRTNQALTTDEGEAIALRGLTFLAEDGARLGRFLAMSGLGPADLRASAGERHVLSGVLGHILQDESMLLVFASQVGLAPDDIVSAHRILAGDDRQRGGGADWQ